MKYKLIWWKAKCQLDLDKRAFCTPSIESERAKIYNKDHGLFYEAAEEYKNDKNQKK